MALSPSSEHGGQDAHPSRTMVPVMACALLWGLQFSFLLPSLALVLSSLFHAGPAQLGGITTVQNLVGLGFSFLIPAWADRRGRYIEAMALCGLLTIAMSVGLWLSPTIGWATAALVAFGAPAAVGNALFFAQLQHIGIERRRMTDIRAVVSFAWVVGMPLSAVVIGTWGPRSLLASFAVIGAANLLATWRLSKVGAAPGRAKWGSAGEQAPVDWRLVAVMTLLYVALQATNAAAVPSTPLLVTQRLGLPVTWSGIALGLAAALEVPSLLALGRLEPRFGARRLLVSGIVSGVVYYAAVAATRSPWVLVGMQVFSAWFVAVVTGIGLTWFQAAIPRAGLAAGLFTNTRRVGAIVAGPMIAAAGVTSLGYAGVFALAAIVCLAGLPVLLLARPRRQVSAAPEGPHGDGPGTSRR